MKKIAQTNENGSKLLKLEVLDTSELISLPYNFKREISNELSIIYREGFPNASEEFIAANVNDYFSQLLNNHKRKAFFWRSYDDEQLIATSIFEKMQIEFENHKISGIYIINRVIKPTFRQIGFSKHMITKFLDICKPDIVLATCAQSAILHTWISLHRKKVIKGFEVYPRIDSFEGKEILKILPDNMQELSIEAFKQLFLGIIGGDKCLLEKEMAKIDKLFVRRNIYHHIYDFNPWNKNGREDKLAEKLHLTNNDGVLLVVIKRTIIDFCISQVS